MVSLLSYSATNYLNNASKQRFPSFGLQSTVRSWTLRHGRLDATCRTMLLSDAEERDAESADEAFAAKLLITPVWASSSRYQIVVDVASRTYKDCTMFFPPTLTFRAMIPDDSKIFRVVRGGSVRKLQKLIESGEGSLRDCDPMGRSLLNVSLQGKILL